MKRLYVPEDLYEQVCDALVEVAANAPMGVGLDEKNVLGPLQNKQQYDIVAKLVQAAKDGGARILVGGEPDAAQDGYFYHHAGGRYRSRQPTGGQGTVRSITDHQIHRPGAGTEWANQLEVGLGSSVWGSDLERCKKVASRLEAGTTWINKHGAVDPRIPFGGSEFRVRPRIRPRRPQTRLRAPHVISW